MSKDSLNPNASDYTPDPGVNPGHTHTSSTLPGVQGMPMGLTGATAATRYVGGTVSGAPVSGTFKIGDYVIDETGETWICTVAGSPGTWVNPANTALSAAQVEVGVIPGVVPDGGATDNYATIQDYLNAMPAGGVAQLPGSQYAGATICIGTSTQIQIPQGVTLKGLGMASWDGGTTPYGTTIVPMKTGTAPTSLVDLPNNSSGLQDINVWGYNPSTANQSTYAVTVEGQICSFLNVNTFGGVTASLYTSSTALRFKSTHGTIRSFGTTYALYNLGTDGKFVNVDISGLTYVFGGPNHFTSCHLDIGPSGTSSSALLNENGGHSFDNCIFDTLLQSDEMMIYRGAAYAPSTYTNCTFFQNAAATYTGNAVFQESLTAGTGAVIIGGCVWPPLNSSSWNAFIAGALASTICSGISVYGSTGITVANFNPSGLGQFSNNTVAGVPVPSTTPTTAPSSTENLVLYDALGGLTLGTAYQNTLSYDVRIVIYLSVTSNTSGVLKLGVGTTTTPTQYTLVTGVTTTGFIPVVFKIPAGYYALLSFTGTVTYTNVGQWLEAA